MKSQKTIRKKSAGQLLLIVIASLIILSSYASAGFGVGFPFKISLNPGETYEGSLSLQNRIEPVEDMTIEIIVEEGEEYIIFPNGKTVQITANETLNIPVKISVPESAEPGAVYKVKMLFKPTSRGTQQGGTVNFILSLGKSFDIEVLGESKNKGAIIIILLLLITIIVVLAVLLIRALGKKK